MVDRVDRAEQREQATVEVERRRDVALQAVRSESTARNRQSEDLERRQDRAEARQVRPPPNESGRGRFVDTVA